MIFFGTRGRTVQGERIRGLSCPSCGHSEFHSFGVLRYFHLYWIPMFPTSKTAGTSCAHCKHTQIGTELPSEVRNKVKAAVFRPRHTVPLFAGLYIIAAVVFALSYTGKQTSVREATYLDQPLVADMYVVNLEKIFEGVDPDYPYGVLQVVDVTGTTVECRLGTIMYSDASGPREDIRKNKTAGDDYYGEQTAYFEIVELKELKATRAISKVARVARN